ncbi:MAG: hypothetical protein DRI44_08880 [Chlamydiae bacterium]|nr:MAG: hypothetical protein DRI44_08880 [Chlamydiota bacterium]
MNYLTTLLITIIIFCFTGCSTLAKPGAGAAIPFAAIADTVVAPFQLTGNAGVALIHLGDRHAEQVFDANKNSVTLPLAQVTSLVYYIPGYILYPFDSITPDNYYSLTKNCLNIINAKPEIEGESRKRKREIRKLPENNFEEW